MDSPTVIYPHLQSRVAVTLRFSNRDLSHSNETELRRRDAAASTVIVFVNQIGVLHSESRIQTLSTHCQLIWNNSKVEKKIIATTKPQEVIHGVNTCKREYIS